MLDKTDTWLLNRFENFSHWWQRTFGQDCFWWARKTVLASMVMTFIGVVMIAGISLEGISAGIFNASISFMWVPFIVRIEAGIKKEPENMCANPEKLKSQDRLFFLVAMPFLAIFIFARLSVLVSLGYILYVFIMYFCACDPLPPAKSKVRQWLESALNGISKALVPKPGIVPVPIPSQ
jgi:hypothetical protein